MSSEILTFSLYKANGDMKFTCMNGRISFVIGQLAQQRLMYGGPLALALLWFCDSS